ncbi:MAG: hypothetical protein M3R55_10585 [Acidobacteriota bacterium]|nr:hypothetical protein [Acidobacteriota bacterium]
MTTTAALACLLGAGSADAQTRFQTPVLPRGFISVNGISQAAGSSFTDRFEFEEFVETGTVETSFDAKAAFGLDGTVGARVWRNFGLGAGLTTFSAGSRNDGGGEVTARIPHPLYLNQHREVTGEAGLRRGETAIHASLLYFVPVNRRVLAVVAAGPTFFQAEQTFVNDVLYDHTYPFDTATFRGVDTDNESSSGVGFNASLDLTWRLSKSFGAGALVRYTQGTLAFTPGTRSLSLDVGGLQAGLGLRVIF